MAKKKPKAMPAQPEAGEEIHPDLRPYAVPIDTLLPDPRNAREHPPENVRATEASLRKFGQYLPLVARRESRTLIVGNNRWKIAQGLGWSHVAVVFVDDDEATAIERAIADNRTAELAKWSPTLAELLGEMGDGTFAEDLLLTDLMLAEQAAPAKAERAEVPVPAIYGVNVECVGEEGQRLIYDLLKRHPQAAKVKLVTM